MDKAAGDKNAIRRYVAMRNGDDVMILADRWTDRDER